jgi:uncharacterized protein (DUF486 family)
MRVSGLWGYLAPILLLLCSNVFMTLALCDETRNLNSATETCRDLRSYA